MWKSFKRTLVGDPISSEQAHHERLSKKTALAVFSSDALSSVAYSTEAIHLYVAHELTHVGAQLDHGEFLEVLDMSVDELIAALDAGKITDAKTVAALLLYVRRFVSR